MQLTTPTLIELQIRSFRLLQATRRWQIGLKMSRSPLQEPRLRHLFVLPPRLKKQKVGSLDSRLLRLYEPVMFRFNLKHGVGSAVIADESQQVVDAPDFVVIDVETACSRVSSICQIGIVGFRSGRIMFEYETLIDPRDHFSSFNTRIHGIAAEHVRGRPCFAEVYDVVRGHLTGRITVAHSYFDKGAVAAACGVHERTMVDTTWLDSVRVAKRAWPELASHKLDVVSRHLGIPLKHHDALNDARAAGMIVLKAIEHTGISLAEWSAPPARQRVPPCPATGRDWTA